MARCTHAPRGFIIVDNAQDAEQTLINTKFIRKVAKVGFDQTKIFLQTSRTNEPDVVHANDSLEMVNALIVNAVRR